MEGNHEDLRVIAVPEYFNDIKEQIFPHLI